MTLFAAQMFDFATFNAMVGSKGVAAEANPLVQGLFLNFGTPAVVIAKILLISLIMALGVAAAVRGGEGRWERSAACHSPSASRPGSSAGSRMRR